MQPAQLTAIEQELKQAQEHLDLQIQRFPDGDVRVTRVQNIIDGLWALLNRARDHHGSVQPADFTDGLNQLHAEMSQVDAGP